MGCDDRGVWPRLFRVETVRGESFRAGGRLLIPEARVAALGKARGSLGPKGISGWGVGFVRVTPLAVLEDTETGVRRIKIVDPTATALAGLFVAAVAMTLFFRSVRWFAQRMREGGT
jgi:uncharacterized spore protein YtfJ